MKGSAAPILKTLREKMKAAAVAVLVVPTSDTHNSEYVADHLQRRSFLTNFRGSAGTAVVTMDKALLWTDGRYWVEAASSLYPEFELMKQGQTGVLEVEDWILEELGAKATVGIDPYVVTVAEWERMSKKVKVQAVDDVIGPMMPTAPEPRQLYQRPAEYSGATVKERREALLDAVRKAKCELIVLTALDEVAWLTNLRGYDVDYNPVFYSYAVLDTTSDKVKLYVDPAKVSDEVRAACADDIIFLKYDQIVWDLETMPAGRAVLVDERQTSAGLFRVMEEKFEVVRTACGPAQSLRGIKNATELQGFRDCHVRDGAALTRYLAWLHEQIAVKKVTDLNEYDAGAKLAGYRAASDKFVQLSFCTISATGPNGAMCHYSPPATGSANIAADALYLVDSGGQYWDGTTDVTRTVCFDAPRAEEVESYTCVLKGHIALDSAVFPKGTTGHRLDVFARHALWNLGLDYAHGTGHGVGSMLAVHEGPHGIGTRLTPTGATLDLNMTVTNEPGFYAEGKYGIRIENQSEVVLATTKYGKDGFLKLAPLTIAPLCRDLIDAAVLSEKERAWVNAYHATVAEKLTPLLAGDELSLAYLKHHTAAI